MLKPLRAAAVAAALLFPLTATGDTMSNDQTAVLAVVETMSTDLKAGDVDAVMSAYEAGAAVAFAPGAPVTDSAAVRAAFAELAGLKPDFSFDDGHEVIVAGDVAIHFAPWNLSATAPNGDAITDTGLSVAVFRRQPDGTWRMVIDNPYGARLLDQ